MKFTVYAAKDEAQAETVWNSVRDFLMEQGFKTVDARYQRIRFEHNGKNYDLKIGDTHPDLHEPVIVILKSSDTPLYYICTTNRGVVRGDPYLVGDGPNTYATVFDPA